MNQDQRDRALRSVFFGQPGPFLYSGKVLDDSVFWSQDRRALEHRLRCSLTRAQMRALGDLFLVNLSARRIADSHAWMKKSRLNS